MKIYYMMSCTLELVCMITCVTLKALGDGADFKTDRTLGKLENFLRMCNHTAKEIFFGYLSAHLYVLAAII